MGLVARMATTLAGGVALGVLVSGVAAAIDGDGSGYTTLLERLVVGAGAPKVAVDTPQAVTVVDQEDIDTKQAETVGEIFDDLPGITMVGSERALGESFNIRGIGSSDSPTSSGDGAKIIISVDGAPKFYEQYRMGSFFSDPELYKSVEVLRGPASSTLYGSGAIGGVVNFTTKDAADFIADGMTGAVRVKQSYSSNGQGTGTSALLAHRINETFDILATGSFRRSELMTLANGGVLQGSDFEAWSGLVKGTMRFGANDEQVLRLSHQRWQSDADDQLYNQTGYIDPMAGGFGTIDRKVTDGTTVLSWENPDGANPLVDIKATLSFSDTEVEQRNPSFPLGSIGEADYGYKTWQGSIQNTSEFSGEGWQNFLTLGGSATRQDRLAAPLGGGIITTHPEGVQQKFALYAQDEQVWESGLTLIGGLRAEYITLDPSPLVVGGSDRQDYALSPKLAALYQLTDEVSIFGSIAHTERVPSLDEMFQYSYNRSNPLILDRLPSLDLVKERADNIELGIATQFYDLGGVENSVAFKATGFYNDIKDGIRSNPRYSSSNSSTWYQHYFVNVANMHIWGLELEGAYESEVLFGRLAYTMTRGEYAADVSPSLPAGTVIDTLAQDKLVLTLGARALDGQLEYGTKLTLAADPLYALGAGQGADGTAEAWNSVDLFASYTPQDGPLAGLEASFAIENVFDADYRENLALDRSRGRTFKLTLAKQFDY